MRWLYHVAARAEPCGALDRDRQGFVHCSFRPDVAETIAVHFAGRSGLDVLRIDPRRVADVRVESTPRGPMPHVYGDVSPDAVERAFDMARAPDAVTGTRFAVVGFARMTLLDLVGVLDPLSRIVSMEIDRDTVVDVVSATDEPWMGSSARFVASSVRPRLDTYDVLVVAGGPETRTLERDDAVVAWLRGFPNNRLVASVCTGALLLGAAGRLRGKRATTHHASLDALPRHGATVIRGERVVRDGQVITGGGVTAALDVGLALVEHIYGADARARIAIRMEYPAAP
jgi:putative intracellular protease/amidase